MYPGERRHDLYNDAAVLSSFLCQLCAATECRYYMKTTGPNNPLMRVPVISGPGGVFLHPVNSGTGYISSLAVMMDCATFSMVRLLLRESFCIFKNASSSEMEFRFIRMPFAFSTSFLTLSVSWQLPSSL